MSEGRREGGGRGRERGKKEGEGKEGMGREVVMVVLRVRVGGGVDKRGGSDERKRDKREELECGVIVVLSPHEKVLFISSQELVESFPDMRQQLFNQSQVPSLGSFEQVCRTNESIIHKNDMEINYRSILPLVRDLDHA